MTVRTRWLAPVKQDPYISTLASSQMPATSSRTRAITCSAKNGPENGPEIGRYRRQARETETDADGTVAVGHKAGIQHNHRAQTKARRFLAVLRSSLFVLFIFVLI